NAEMIHLPVNGSASIVGKTAADGTFRVTVSLKDGYGSFLFPRVDGFAPGDYLRPATNTPAEFTFKLIKDTPIRGKVIDTQGKPVVGASVVVRHMNGFDTDSADSFLVRWLKRQPDEGGPNSKWFASFRSWDD